MPYLMGMDEAGYGPNLGPLVVTATSWEVCEDPFDCDLFERLAEVVSRDRSDANGRLHVGDSKQVYSPARGLASLETPVLALLQAAGFETSTFRHLWEVLAVDLPADHGQEPWFADSDITLPVAATQEMIAPLAARFNESLNRGGIGFPRIVCELVLTERFNRLVWETDSKGLMLSGVSLSLLRRVWNPDSEAVTLIVCDKHGGRNRYDRLLANVLDGQMIFRLLESQNMSAYRIGNTEIRFQTKGEAHFPVAVASMVSKYLRELSMLVFNRFWSNQVPDLKPTKGYPTDARRFRSQIATKQAELGIDDNVLWRNR